VSILLAVIAVVVAAVAVSVMVVSVVAARAVRERLGHVTLRASRSVDSVRGSLRESRQVLARSAEATDRMRLRSQDLDVRVDGWTTELARVRGSVERAGRDRLERVIKVLAGIASVARFMVLWKP